MTYFTFVTLIRPIHCFLLVRFILFSTSYPLNDHELRLSINNYTLYNDESPYTSIVSWDTSQVADMKWLFGKHRGTYNNFQGDLSKWNTSKVTTLYAMFRSCTLFNSDLSQWDVSLVTDMASLFDGAESFNSNLELWDVSGVIYMNHMFDSACEFNSNLNKWDIQNVLDMNFIFHYARKFNQKLCWNLEKVRLSLHMFKNSQGMIREYPHCLGGVETYNGEEDL